MKPTITLVDGYKDSGRSEVARTLAVHLDAYHFVGQLNTTPKEFVDAMSYALNDMQHVVIERSWQFEQFCKTIGQGCYIRSEHARMLDRLALARDGYVIKCMPDTSVILENAYTRHASSIDINHLVKQSHLWKDYPVTLPAHEFLDTMEPELLLGAVNTSCANAGPGIGMWNPENVYLIVGEKPKLKKTSPLAQHISFCDVEHHLSFWLSEQLHKNCIPEHKLYWINPVTTDGDWTNPDFIKLLKPLHIFSVGILAEEWCIKHELNTRRVPHPTYFKQFCPGEIYPLAGYLQYALAQPHLSSLTFNEN